MNHEISDYFAVARLFGGMNHYPLFGRSRHVHVSRHNTKKGPGRIPSRQRDFYLMGGEKVYKFRNVRGVAVTRCFGKKRRCKRAQGRRK